MIHLFTSLKDILSWCVSYTVLKSTMTFACFFYQSSHDCLSALQVVKSSTVHNTISTSHCSKICERGYMCLLNFSMTFKYGNMVPRERERERERETCVSCEAALCRLALVLSQSAPYHFNALVLNSLYTWKTVLTITIIESHSQSRELTCTWYSLRRCGHYSSKSKWKLLNQPSHSCSHKGVTMNVSVCIFRSRRRKTWFFDKKCVTILLK